MVGVGVGPRPTADLPLSTHGPHGLPKAGRRGREGGWSGRFSGPGLEVALIASIHKPLAPAP